MWLLKNRILVKKNVSTSWLVIFWYNHYSLATVHSFLSVHIGFWMLRIAIRPNWNNYHNIINATTSLHLDQIKWISDSHYFLLFFTNPTLQQVPVTKLYVSTWMQVSLLGALARTIGRIYSSITQNLKFNRSMQITWKRNVVGKSDLFEKTLIFVQLLSFLTLWDRWFIFIKQISK